MFNIFKRKPKVAEGPPEGGAARSYIRINKHGERETHIIGEIYPLRGHSRAEILLGKMGEFKTLMKAAIKLIAGIQKDAVPQENLKLPVRALAEEIDFFVEAEVNEWMKEKWLIFKKAFVPFLEEDDAYCFRYQLLMERLAKRIKEIRLSKADKYYFHSRKDFKWDLKK